MQQLHNYISVHLQLCFWTLLILLLAPFGLHQLLRKHQALKPVANFVCLSVSDGQVVHNVFIRAFSLKTTAEAENYPVRSVRVNQNSK